MFLQALIIVGLMVLMSFMGFIMRKTDAVGNENKGLSVVLLYIAQPCMVVSALQGYDYASSALGNMGVMALLAVITQTLILAAAFFVFKFNKDDKQRRVYAFASAFSNCGFMGIPLMRALIPENTALPFYAVIYVIIFNLLAWTAGIYIITGDKKYISLKNAFLNPVTLALVVALPMFFFNVKFPEKLGDVISVLGSMTTPLCMIILGIKLADVKVKDLFSGVSVYVCAVIKLFIAPLFAYLITLPFDIEQSVVIAITLAVAMPTASMTIVFAERHGGDVTAGAKAQLITTFLSILTVPIITLLF